MKEEDYQKELILWAQNGHLNLPMVTDQSESSC